MANRAKQPTMSDRGAKFPPEAFEYNDDVTTEVVKKLKAERGVDTSDKRWRVIDGFGQVVPA